MNRILYVFIFALSLTGLAWAEDKTPDSIYTQSLNESGQTSEKAAGCLAGDCNTENMWGGELHRYTAKPIKTRVEQYLPENNNDEQKSEEVK